MGLGSKLKKRVRGYKRERKRKKRVEAEIRKEERRAYETGLRAGRIRGARIRGFNIGLAKGRGGGSSGVFGWLERRAEAASRNIYGGSTRKPTSRSTKSGKSRKRAKGTTIRVDGTTIRISGEKKKSTKRTRRKKKKEYIW